MAVPLYPALAIARVPLARLRHCAHRLRRLQAAAVEEEVVKRVPHHRLTNSLCFLYFSFSFSVFNRTHFLRENTKSALFVFFCEEKEKMAPVFAQDVKAGSQFPPESKKVYVVSHESNEALAFPTLKSAIMFRLHCAIPDLKCNDFSSAEFTKYVETLRLSCRGAWDKMKMLAEKQDILSMKDLVGALNTIERDHTSLELESIAEFFEARIGKGIQQHECEADKELVPNQRLYGISFPSMYGHSVREVYTEEKDAFIACLVHWTEYEHDRWIFADAKEKPPCVISEQERLRLELTRKLETFHVLVRCIGESRDFAWLHEKLYCRDISELRDVAQTLALLSTSNNCVVRVRCMS
jgi:hypothetical protein